MAVAVPPDSPPIGSPADAMCSGPCAAWPPCPYGSSLVWWGRVSGHACPGRSISTTHASSRAFKDERSWVLGAARLLVLEGAVSGGGRPSSHTRSDGQAGLWLARLP